MNIDILITEKNHNDFTIKKNTNENNSSINNKQLTDTIKQNITENNNQLTKEINKINDKLTTTNNVILEFMLDRGISGNQLDRFTNLLKPK